MTAGTSTQRTNGASDRVARITPSDVNVSERISSPARGPATDIHTQGGLGAPDDCRDRTRAGSIALSPEYMDADYVDAESTPLRVLTTAPSTAGARRLHALRQVATLVIFGVLPVAALATMLGIGLSDHSLSADFHHEIYPQAKL